jgi:hypothetical protein
VSASIPLTELEAVRDLTSSDLETLPDVKIQQYLLEFNNRSRRVRILLAAAKCVEYINRDNQWQSETSVSNSASGNMLLERARDYRRQAAALEPFIL